MSMGKMKLTRRVRGFRQVHRPLLVLLMLGTARLVKGQLSEPEMREHGFVPIEEDLHLRGDTPGANVDAGEICELLKKRMDDAWYTFAMYSYKWTRHRLECGNGNPCLHVGKFMKKKNQVQEFKYNIDISKLSSDRRVVFSSTNSDRTLGNLWVHVQGTRYVAIIWKDTTHIWYRSTAWYEDLGPKLEPGVFAAKRKAQEQITRKHQQSEYRQQEDWREHHHWGNAADFTEKEWEQYMSEQRQWLAGELQRSRDYREQELRHQSWSLQPRYPNGGDVPRHSAKRRRRRGRGTSESKTKKNPWDGYKGPSLPGVAAERARTDYEPEQRRRGSTGNWQ